MSKFSARHRRTLKDDFRRVLRLIRVFLSGLKFLDLEALRIRRKRTSHLEGFTVVVVGASVVVVVEVVGLILRRSLGRGGRVSRRRVRPLGAFEDPWRPVFFSSSEVSVVTGLGVVGDSMIVVDGFAEYDSARGQKM